MAGITLAFEIECVLPKGTGVLLLPRGPLSNAKWCRLASYPKPLQNNISMFVKRVSERGRELETRAGANVRGGGAEMKWW